LGESEEEVRSKATEVIKNTTGLSMAGFSLNDVYRLRTFYDAAREANRKLAISMKQAFLLHHLKNNPRISIFTPNDRNVLIFSRDKQYTYAWEDELILTVVPLEYWEKLLNLMGVQKKS
jgi:ribonuclease J